MPTMLGVVADSYNAPAVGGGLPVSGAVGWWDASDPATITQSGGLVSQWNDKSGGGRHFTQSADAQKPRIDSAVRNGRQVLTFSTDDYISFVGNTNLNTQAVSMFIVSETVVDVQYAGLFSAWYGGLADNSNPGSFAITMGEGFQTLIIERESVALATIAGGGTMPLSIYTITLKPDKSGELRENGVIGTAGTPSASTPDIATGGYNVGSRYLGYYGYHFNGHVGEIIIYNRVLSDSERIQIEDYLKDKWLASIPYTGLNAWWDASAPSVFSIVTGDQISQWKDRSGKGYHANQVNASWPATRIPTAINGLTAFDPHPGGFNTTLPSMPKPFTVAIALKTPSVSNNSLLGISYGSPSGGHFTIDNWGNKWRMLKSGVQLIGETTTAWVENTSEVLVVSYGSDDVWAFHRNGVASGTGTTAATFPASLIGLGNDAVPSSANYSGLFGEILVYDHVLTIPERQQIESYLKSKWGTP